MTAVDPADLGGIAEIADRYGVTPQTVNNWASRGGFPAPLRELKQGRLWSLAGVHVWVGLHRRELLG